MEEIIIYLGISSVCLSVLFLVYEFMLKKETYFQMNRIYLLLVLLVSHVIPLLKLPRVQFFTNSNSTYVQTLGLDFQIERVAGPDYTEINLRYILSCVFLVIIAVHLVKFIFNIIRILFLIKKGERESFEGFSFYNTSLKTQPFSFFNAVLINQKLVGSNYLKEVLIHESEHIKRKHTFDLLLLELIISFHWFNPIVYLLRRRLVALHEYQADSAVISSIQNIVEYQSFLYSIIKNKSRLLVVNTLSNSLIKNRFIMMNKKKSSVKSKMKLFLTLPVTAILVLVFSCTQENKGGQKVDGKKVEIIELNRDSTAINGLVSVLKDDLGGNVFLKEFESHIENGSSETFKMVLMDKTTYSFGIIDHPSIDGDCELLLYDSIQEVASTKGGEKKENTTCFEYTTNYTGEYSVQIRSTKNTEAVAIGGISFVGRVK